MDSTECLDGAGDDTADGCQHEVIVGCLFECVAAAPTRQNDEQQRRCRERDGKVYEQGVRWVQFEQRVNDSIQKTHDDSLRSNEMASSSVSERGVGRCLSLCTPL